MRVGGNSGFSYAFLRTITTRAACSLLLAVTVAGCGLGALSDVAAEDAELAVDDAVSTVSELTPDTSESAEASDTTTTDTTTTDTTTTETTTTEPEPVGEVAPGSVEAEPGFQVISDEETRFEMLVPERYSIIGLTDDDLTAFVEGDGDDELGELLAEQIAQQGEQFDLWLFDFEQGTDAFTPNVNVQVNAKTPFDELDVIENAVPTEYESVGLELLRMDRIPTASGEAVIAETLLPEADGTEYYVVQLFAVGTEDVYIFSWTFEDEPDATLRAEIDRSFASFTPVSG